MSYKINAITGQLDRTISDKTDIGLGNVDNTSDLNKPVSTATQTALNLKANLSGATFTGAITATNLSGTNTGDGKIQSYLLPIYCSIMGNPATSQSATANMVYYTFIDIPIPCTADAIIYSVGSATAGNIQAGLYQIATANKNDNANTLTGATLIGSSASTAVGAINTAQPVAFSSSIPLTPGKYFLAIQFSSASASFMRGGGFSNGFNFAKLNTEAGFTLPTTVITASANSVSPYMILRTITNYS